MKWEVRFQRTLVVESEAPISEDEAYQVAENMLQDLLGEPGLWYANHFHYDALCILSP